MEAHRQEIDDLHALHMGPQFRRAAPLYRSKLNFTSSAVQGSPLWKRSPSRSLNSYTRPSGLSVQDSARLWPIFSPGIGRITPSWRAYSTARRDKYNYIIGVDAWDLTHRDAASDRQRLIDRPGRLNIQCLEGQALFFEDVRAMHLGSEPVDYDSRVDPRINLRECGATEEECDVLVRRSPSGRWTGERVELNAMTSDQFVAWLEGKLDEVGVAKVIPDRDTLEHAYRRAVRRQHVQEAIDEAVARVKAMADAEIVVPDDLEEQIREKLDGSDKSWDQVLWDLVADGEADANG